ncbi:MAG TPA: alpha/beta fold hydrolase [Propionibacteriaceae bacterium]|nr:alpha/beta fold hydrolase [Propionibacteriaceae bacterium]
MSSRPLSGDQIARALHGMPEVNPAWSRLVSVRDAAGVVRNWHVLDTGGDATAGTMVCVHGNPTWSYLWRRFLGLAAPGWRAVAVDQLGMGYSDRLSEPRTLADRIDDLSRLTSELSITGRVVLAAHDWGGPISLGWALAHQDQVAGVVLANTGVAVPAKAAAPWLIRLARSPALRELVCVRTPTFVSTAAALSRPPLPVAVREALRAPYKTPALRQSVGDFVADIPLESDHPSRATLDSVAARLGQLGDVPALLLWGPRDPVFRGDQLRDLRQRLPKADVHRYAQASHLVIEDVPQAAEDTWRWVAERVNCVPSRVSPPAAVVQERADDQPMIVELGAALRTRAHDHDTAVAELGVGGATITSFSDLSARVEALAAGLSSVKVKPGDRVALMIRPGLDLTAAVYACWRVGASIVVADAGLGLRRMVDALRSADPDHLIAIPAGLAAAAAFRLPGQRFLAGQLPDQIRKLLKVDYTLSELIENHQRVGAATEVSGQSHPVVLEDEAEAAVLFTSGATGAPKGVVYRHRQLRAQLELVRAVFDIRPGDRMVAAFAPFALYGPALGIGTAAPAMDVTKPGTLTATALADAAAAIQATQVFASPAALRNVAATAGHLAGDKRAALGKIRLLLSAGAPVPVPLLRQVQELLPAAELHTPYGMTEALPVTDISLTEIEEAGPGNGVCVGRPLSGVKVQISPMDLLGRATGELTDAADITGEICVAAAHVKDRYDRLWATEAASSRNPGWHRTGDVGHLDPEGRLWVEGRLLHVITPPAGPLTPVGVEQRIQALGEVSAAALVGVGPAGTQQPVAIVAARAPKAARPSPLSSYVPALRRHARAIFDSALADQELTAAVRAAAGIPLAAVLVVDSLPVDIRHASKVDRTRLAVWAERVLAGGRVGRP